jgi:hypothetical protein
LPSPFSALDSVLLHQRVGIVKYVPGKIETDAVFSPVRFCFEGIPFKLRHYYIITPNL